MSFESLWSSFRFAVLVPAQAAAERWRYPLLAGSASPEFRPYRPGDERAIIRLFHQTYRHEKSLEHWRWAFLRNPYGVANIVLLDGRRAGIVGHYGGIAAAFQVQRRVVSAAQGVDVMLHPALRRGHWFARLGREYIQLSRASGARLLYGFNENVMARMHRRAFGVTLVPVCEWVCELSGGSASGQEPVLVETGFDDRVDALWERIEAAYPYAVVRDRRYLTWRYLERPDRAYVILSVAASVSETAGLAVLGVHGSDGVILELLAHPDDEAAVTQLLRASVRHFGRTGRRRVRAWIPGHGRLHDCARAAGFVPLDSGFFLNLLPLDDAMDTASLAARFYYSLGDYDVP